MLDLLRSGDRFDNTSFEAALEEAKPRASMRCHVDESKGIRHDATDELTSIPSRHSPSFTTLP